MAILYWMFQELEEELSKRKAADVRIGLGYTGVLLDDGAMGLAYTFRHDTEHGCGVMAEAGSLCRGADELARMAGSKNVVEAAVGLAAMNAAVNRPGIGEPGDIVEHLRLEDSDRIGMVGFFAPIADRLAGRDITVFETEQSGCKCKVPVDKQPELLPQMDIVLVTATTLVNHTADNVLLHCRNAREVVMLGPSTPLLASVFKDTAVTLLAGTIVEDTARALDIISQGGGTQKLGKVSRKVVIRIKEK